MQTRCKHGDMQHAAQHQHRGTWTGMQHLPQECNTCRKQGAPPDSDEVLEGLAHLQALDAQVPRVQEVIDPLLAAAGVVVRLRLQQPGRGGEGRARKGIAGAGGGRAGRATGGSGRSARQLWWPGLALEMLAGDAAHIANHPHPAHPLLALGDLWLRDSCGPTCASSLSWCGKRRSPPHPPPPHPPTHRQTATQPTPTPSPASSSPAPARCRGGGSAGPPPQCGCPNAAPALHWPSRCTQCATLRGGGSQVGAERKS